jgi:hypothetical protein
LNIRAEKIRADLVSSAIQEGEDAKFVTFWFEFDVVICVVPCHLSEGLR